MASFVAIAKTRNSGEVLDELVKQCFVILPDDPFTTPLSVANAVEVLFGIRLADKDVAQSLKRLTSDGSIGALPGGQMGLSPSTRQELDARILDARKLEEDVRQVWLNQISKSYPKLDGAKLWQALRAYLGQAFRRHGMQAIALLDSTAEIARGQSASLSSILESVIRQDFSPSEHDEALHAVSSFIATVRTDRKRAEYITQLADGAFNYFSLTVAPEVSEKLRGRLNALTLFLDTNFLFGLLNLHVNPQVDVSAELCDSVTKFKLPFRLRYHDATTHEMTNTLFYFGGELRKQKWPQNISRAAASSGRMAGIELRYHQKNAEHRVDVEDFLAPYQHWGVLLKDKGIDVYKVDSSEQRLRARADLEADYRDFLSKTGKEKPPEAIQHDMAVLETVRSLRSAAKSTLDAGALLVTCDYSLFRFDYETSRAEEKQCCSVLPSLLWQLLRPFVSDSIEFDKAFAETFALPEFSLTRGGAAKAASKMLSILAGYRDIPEETASKMLANDLLLTELQTKRTDAEFEKTVESALAKQNVSLLEERAALAKQLTDEKQQREAKERQLTTTSKVLEEKQRELERKDQDLREKEASLTKVKEEKLGADQQIRNVVDQALQEKEAKELATREVVNLRVAHQRAEEEARNLKRILAAVAGFGLALIFEWVVNSVLPWRWLREHPQSIGLQACMSAVILFFVAGSIIREWRKWCFGVGILSFLAVAFQIIGGFAKP
jgi:hypothetical protein